jgi:hypothetical protein
VSFWQLVNVKRSILLQFDKGCSVPSLISGACSGVSKGRSGCY